MKTTPRPASASERQRVGEKAVARMNRLGAGYRQASMIASITR